MGVALHKQKTVNGVVDIGHLSVEFCGVGYRQIIRFSGCEIVVPNTENGGNNGGNNCGNARKGVQYSQGTERPITGRVSSNDYYYISGTPTGDTS